MLEIACMVEAGIRHPLNDDRAAVNNTLVSTGTYTETIDKSCLLVICDGVGGEAFGNEAAEIVTNFLSSRSKIPLTTDLASEYVTMANKAVMAAQHADKKHSKMATTVAGLYINGDDFIAFNVGDTRIYRYRSFITQISHDHSVRQEQIDIGLEPKPGQENVITRYVGGKLAIPEIVNGKDRVFPSDIYLLCSDGVWGVIDNSDFENILSMECKTVEMCTNLINLALKKGSKDNLSVIIARRT
jgi:protein phosphatase